ncbi:MAG: type I DNA topoisomerase [Lachnospiraceae bacterium]|nr:type I DNA topoisomerase [Lachnospiraceae bacterium]
MANTTKSKAKTSKKTSSKSKSSSKGKHLVIVESPTKASTIKKFLGSKYEVVASAGHVRDLPKSKMGIDIEHDYEPQYITIRGKGETLAMLRKKVKDADKVYLATDPDREGEAISWHLYYALKLNEKDCSRITFNEITKNAVKESIKNAREIDMNLVDAQQARRVLDRVVGYEISPLLWIKIKRGLSAGRVQSVVLRLVCDREEEINAFIPEEYWSLEAEINEKGVKKPLIAKFSGNSKGKLDIHSAEEMKKIKDTIAKNDFVVSSIKNGERVKKGPLPFTTSTLQQDAARKLNFSTKKTMQIAQQLYEGMPIKGHGTIGLITYLRTDSVRVSDEAKTAAKDYIKDHFGDEFVVKASREPKSKKKIQDAHEAIRPSYVDLQPINVKADLPRDHFRLYQLIYNRFLASQMEDAIYDTVTAKIEVGDYRFTASASHLKFEGFLAVYDLDGEKADDNRLISKLKEGMVLSDVTLVDKQHFTQAPARYTEQTMVKTMEELGIGRPSTYSSTINTIMARRYVVKDGKSLCPTELGDAVNDMMKKAFPVVVDVDFTANIEMLLDAVEEGGLEWKDIIRNNYPELHDSVVKAQDELDKIEIADEVTDVICEKCGRNMVVKYGPYGKFLACPGFPECTNTKPHFEKIGVACPKCGSEIAYKKTKKGRVYYGCIEYPECDFMSWQRPSKLACPKCGKYMLIKGKKVQCSDEQCGYVRELTDEDIENK